MTPRIMTVGSCMMDLVSVVDQAPAPGETVFGREFAVIPGGKGFNQAVACARMGASTSIVGRLGNDDFESVFSDLALAEKLDVTNLEIDPDHGTGVSLIIVDTNGENRIVANPRANAYLGSSIVETAFEKFQPDGLLMCHEVPDEPLVRAAHLAAAAQKLIVFNAAPAGPVPGELMRLVDVVIVNESEAAVLTGIAQDGVAEAQAAATALRALGASAAVVTLGEIGSVFESASNAGYVNSFPTIAVDTTGAGDAFCAALVVGLCSGLELADAVKLGNAAGSLTVRTMGVTPALPRRAQVFDLAQIAIG